MFFILYLSFCHSDAGETLVILFFFVIPTKGETSVILFFFVIPTQEESYLLIDFIRFLPLVEMTSALCFYLSYRRGRNVSYIVLLCHTDAGETSVILFFFVIPTKGGITSFTLVIRFSFAELTFLPVVEMTSENLLLLPSSASGNNRKRWLTSLNGG